MCSLNDSSLSNTDIKKHMVWVACRQKQYGVDCDNQKGVGFLSKIPSPRSNVRLEQGTVEFSFRVTQGRAGVVVQAVCIGRAPGGASNGA